MSHHPWALGRIRYDSDQHFWTVLAGKFATILTSTFTDLSLKDAAVGTLEGLLTSNDVPLPSITLDNPVPNAQLYLPQILKTIESSKGPDYAALYLIGSCTQCLQYWKSEKSEAWKDSAFLALNVADKNYPKLQLAVDEIWDILRDLSDDDLAPEALDALFTSIISAQAKGQAPRRMLQEHSSAKAADQRPVTPEGYELLRCNDGSNGELIDLLMDQIGLFIYNPIGSNDQTDSVNMRKSAAGKSQQRNEGDDEELVREFLRLRRPPDSSESTRKHIADRERDEGIGVDRAQALLKRLWRRRVAFSVGCMPRHDLLQRVAGLYNDIASEDTQASAQSSPPPESRSRPLTIKFPPEAAERYWGESRDKAPSAEFDPFALPKQHLPGRAGILQPNLVAIPDLESAFAALQLHPSPPVSDADIDFLTTLGPQNSAQPPAAFKDDLCPACGRFNWPKLFARFLDSHDIFGHAERDPFVSGLRNHQTTESHTVEFDDEWWPSEAIRAYPISFFGWVLTHQKKCALCKLIAEAIRGLGQSMPQQSHVLVFWFSEGCSGTAVSRAMLHISSEELLSDKGGNNPLVSFSLLDDGVTPLRSLKTISPMRMMTTQLSDLNLAPWVVPPLAGDRVDLALLKGWLSEDSESHHACKSHRKELSGEKAAPTAFRLRLIDVLNDEVVRPFHQCTYVCLSYVWGSTTQYKASVKDRVCCEKKHACASMGRPVIPITRSKLPRTIQDAMAVVEAIGERYLWVDALCIVQDDETELSNTLKFMHKIYENALFTIVAADGTNADAGLPGVRPDSRQVVNVTATVNSIPLIQHRPFLQLDETPWAKRAWTFQEALFSRAWLVFARDTVYYSCAEGMFSEQKPDDKAAEPNNYKDRHTFRLSDLHKPASCRLWTDYKDKVQQFTARQLSFQQDILNAFAGIMEFYEEKIGTKFCWGLPTKSDQLFVLSLLWGAGEAGHGTWLKLQRRSVQPPRHLKSQSAAFPSWSWAGWTGGTVTWEWPGDEDDAPLDICSEIQWHREKGQSSALRNQRLDVCNKFGLLHFYTKLVALSPSDLDPQCPVYMDNGTKWETGKKDCILIASMPKHQPTVFFLVVRQNARGFYFREGVCAMALEKWHELERIIEVKFKDVQLI